MNSKKPFAEVLLEDHWSGGGGTSRPDAGLVLGDGDRGILGVIHLGEVDEVAGRADHP